jgi:hypothetical protein
LYCLPVQATIQRLEFWWKTKKNDLCPWMTPARCIVVLGMRVSCTKILSGNKLVVRFAKVSHPETKPQTSNQLKIPWNLTRPRSGARSCPRHRETKHPVTEVTYNADKN